MQPFGLPHNHDPLQLSNIYFDTCYILDQCYRQVLSGPTVGPVPLPMHMALDFKTEEFNGGTRAKTLLDISGSCNIPNPQVVKRFLQEHHFLFHTRAEFHGGGVLTLIYSAPSQLRNFFFDPGRCRHLYSIPRIIDNCLEAIKDVLEMRGVSYSTFPFSIGLQGFFLPNQHCQFSCANLMLSESIINGSNNTHLLRFLGFLHRMPWYNCFRSESARCTLAICEWVCKALVS